MARKARSMPKASCRIFNTGAAQKYVEVMAVELPRVKREAVDWGLIAGGN